MELLQEDPKAFLLLTHIALRARRTQPRFSKMALEVNQAVIGDYKKIGLTRQEYRKAKERLSRYGLATFKSTNRGTIATLFSQEVYDINPEIPIEEPSDSSMQIKQTEPAKSHPEASEEPSAIQPQTSNQPLTRMKEEKKCKETTTAVQSIQANLYECLQAEPGLIHEEKCSLMIYPEERVQAALQWAQTATIKTTLIQALHWHCKELNPPVPQSQHKSSNYTPQQQTAWEYNRVLQENGYDKLFAQNQTAIPNDFAHIFLMGRATTISLKNPISQVVADFTASKREILNKGDQNA